MKNDLLANFVVGIICSLAFCLVINLFSVPGYSALLFILPFYAINTAVCFHIKRKDYFDDLINHSLMGILVLIGATAVSSFLFFAAGILVPVLILLLYSIFLRYRYKLQPERVSIATLLFTPLIIIVVNLLLSSHLPIELVYSSAICLSGLFPYLVFRNKIVD